MFKSLKEKLHHHAAPQQQPLTSSNRSDSKWPKTKVCSSFADRGANLTHLTLSTFYSPHDTDFRSPYAELGTVDAHHGYVVWPVAITLWALSDLAARTKSPADIQNVHAAFAAMEKYWSEELGGYCAWHWYEGNRDVYYDDNAHAGNALVSAYEATGDSRFLKQAETIVTRLIDRGWDRGDGLVDLETGSRGPGVGGVAWHVQRNRSRNACSTLSVAVLACRLVLLDVERRVREYALQLARCCIEFAEKWLIDGEDGLVIDNISWKDESGSWEPDRVKYTYNTGFAIEAYMLWAKITGNGTYLDRAVKMALTAVDGESALFDKAVPDPDSRMWWDSTFFAHHLVDALVFAVESEPDTEVARRVQDFLLKFAAYCRKYLQDPADGLYYRNLRLYRIGEEQTRTFDEMFGTTQKLDADSEEREEGQGPVEQRRLIKTLLGNASMARIFLLVSDLEQNIPMAV